MKAGTYFVGDPCYVINDKEWHIYLDACDYGNINPFQFNGHSAWVDNTAFGDGVYYDQHGNQFPVDSGLIGVTPIEVCDQAEVNNALERQLGVIISPEKDFSTSCSDKGTFYIGNMIIDTGEYDDGDGEEDDVMFSKVEYEYEIEDDDEYKYEDE